ncbi:MAG: hypothetical protein AB8B56_04785 [Crocinitomicaceae bacterium]
MLKQKNDSASRFRSREFQVILFLFFALWSYVIVRAFLVFYNFDEIFTKWNYVIDWNALPHSGTIDANNHFLMSFLGGLFIRLFQSEEMFIVRLGSVLAFPIYFWSVYRLKNFFTHEWNFYACLIAFTTACFLLEFFSMARGYGLSMAFLLFALQQTMHYFKNNQKRAFYWALFGWLMTMSASLTILPMVAVAIIHLSVCVVKRKFYLGLLWIAILCVPLWYYIDYSFVLKDLGKFYYGGTHGFFESTVHSLTWFLWKITNVWVDIVVFIAGSFIFSLSIWRFLKKRDFFDAKLVFTIFLFASVGSILAQHWILDVNYPTDRTAITLIAFFFGGLFFALDEVRFGKWIGISTIGCSLILFFFSANFSHSKLFIYEHLDHELVEIIPTDVKGTPPTTAGRSNLENELNRSLDLPFRAFQEINQTYDTLTDYAILFADTRPDLMKMYDIVHTDEISSKSLLKRKRFLNRNKTFENSTTLRDSSEFHTMLKQDLEGPVLLRLTGHLGEIAKENDVLIVFTSEDSLTKQIHTWESFSLIENTKEENGIFKFDFSYAMNALEGANSFATYLWHKNPCEIQGEIKVQVYRLEE